MLFDLSVVAPNDALYKELWHACAGPLVTVPREGEIVYYFPQGHMEQVPFPFTFLLAPLLYTYHFSRANLERYMNPSIIL